MDSRDQIEESAKDYAEQIGINYFDTRPKVDLKPLVGRLTVVGMQAYGIVPVSVNGTILTLGITEETDRAQLESLRHRLAGYDVEYVFISQFGWNRMFNRYSIAINHDILETGDFGAFTQRIMNIEPKFIFEPVAELAYQLGASDIHVEPGESDARIRFRVDGTLHEIARLPRDRYELFASDLQMRAGVKWGSDEPQGGRVSLIVINDEGDEIQLNMRLETLPSLHGEDVVVRLFNLSVQYLTLENLNLGKKQYDILVKCTSHPRGLVMSVGPTGSGKTSTLYSIMNHLNNDEIKIITLEDPVEYELHGISQVPVRSDNQQLFMDKLRAVLREDPNIIMIGEIRDADTAKTALQASLTGHLVLSTFHANSSSAAVSRLMDMVGQNVLMASSIKLIMAQRLVRRLCTKCKATREPTKEELEEIKSALVGLPEKSYPSLNDIKLGKAVGCSACHHFGYSGRLIILEQLEITPQMEEFIAHGTQALTAEAIEAEAKKEGMVSLLQDGVLRVLEKETTLEEINVQVGA